MARKLDMKLSTDPKKSTVQPGQPNLDDNPGRIVSSGVGLTERELAAIDELTEKYEVTRNSLLRFAVRWFIRQVWAGNVDLTPFVEEPTRKKNKLHMP